MGPCLGRRLMWCYCFTEQQVQSYSIVCFDVIEIQMLFRVLFNMLKT